MNSIAIDFSSSYIGTIAKQGEHNKTQLVFYLPDDFAGADYVNVEFEKSNKDTAVIERLTPENGVITVPLTQELTNICDKIDIQLVAYAVDGVEITEIAKSLTVHGVIRPSLNVLFNHNEPGVIERTIAFVHEWTDKLIEMWNAKHNHENRELLDTLTPEMFDKEQVDWNENDSTSGAYVVNRTHWQEEDTVTRNYTVEWAGTTPVYQQQPWNATDLGVVLTENKNYVLNVAGETFDGACQKIVIPSSEEVLSTVYYIGNIGIFDGTDTGDGFPVLFTYAELSYASTGDIFERINALMTYSSFFGNDLSFSITNEETVYHKLPNEYLDDELFRSIQYSHSHINKKTLDALRFPLSEHDYGQPTHESEKYLQICSDPSLPKTYEHLRKCEDGSVIKKVETVTKPNGEKVIRIVTNDSPSIIHSVPRFIDIPIQTSAQEQAADEGIVINGIAVDLGFNELEGASHEHSNKSVLDTITQQAITNIAENTAARHTHDNNYVLQHLTSVQIGFGGRYTVAWNNPNMDYENVLGFYPRIEVFDAGENTFSGSIDSNVEYVFGSEQNPAASIVITALLNSVSDQANEFFIDFYSGSTPTIITLPASVEWVDELMAESNKHYQISILDNIALWCAVDVEAVSE